MKALAITGLVLIILTAVLTSYVISDYTQYVAYQAQADKETIECENTICLGMPASFDADMFYRRFNQELLAGLMVGSVGLVFLSLNIRDLAMPDE